MNFIRFILLYMSGLAEGALMIAAGDHHWSAWPGVIWLILPVAVATGIYVQAEAKS